MLSNIMLVLSVIKEIFALIKMFTNVIEKTKIADAEKHRQSLAKAVEDLKKAKIDEEIFDAQKRIVDSSH